MKNDKAFYRIGSIAAVVGYVLLSQAYGQNLKPSSEPIFSTPQAKPNIHMVLDDSGSMGSRDIYLVDENGGKTLTTRNVVLRDTVKKLFYKYRDKAYLGFSVLNRHDGSILNAPGQNQGLIRLPLSDFSELTGANFKSQIIDKIDSMLVASGGTPMYNGVYEAFKMYRGYPVRDGVLRTESSKWGTSYPVSQLETPLRYRCQPNHLILMTDGEPDGNETISAPVVSDITIPMGSFEKAITGNIYHGVDKSNRMRNSFRNFNQRRALGELMANTDLRDAAKWTFKNGQWVNKTLDDAGRDWHDLLSLPLNLTAHSVSLAVNRNSPVYTSVTAPSEGMNLGVDKTGGTSTELLLAFDTIFASIVRSTSSSFSKNDRTYADVLDGIPPKKNGRIDLSKIGAIRYDTIYNFRQKFGSLRAVVPYRSDEVLPNGKRKVNVDVIWDSNLTIKPNQGKYVTFLNTTKNGLEINTLDSAATKKQFTEILKKVDSNAVYDNNYIRWLTNFERAADSGLRGRLNPMGSITNSDIQLVNKDVLHINVVPKMMSSDLSKELINYLFYKAKFQLKNYVIVSDNDGFINFINAERGLTGNYKGGERDTAYFPQLLAKRLPEITKPNSNATLVLEGKTRIIDGKVYQPDVGNIYTTIGLTSMGTGGQGIVGYRMFGATEQSVKDWSISKGASNTNQAIMSQVTPLFEIDGTDIASGYDLGYTFSDFEAFNRIIKENGEERGQIVAVFGNGMADKSRLYFMDAYTGKKLHSINLPGVAAMSIAASVYSDPEGNGQRLDRLYVGDYLGSLYRIDFKGKDFTDDAKTEVTYLFQAPQHASKKFQSAITAKLLLIKDDKTGYFSIAFGTGVANNHERDRGDNAAVEHSLYSITDRNKSSSQSTTTVAGLKNGYEISPLLTVNNLKEGTVGYQDGTNIDYSKTAVHDLSLAEPIIKDGQSNNSGKDGWYMRLIADGTKSGERLLQAPKYDSVYKAAIFATWGVSERILPYEDNGLYDPCLADLAFGKELSFDPITGGAAKTPGSNKGRTNDAGGVPTGDSIIDSPTGNEVTDITQLETMVEKNLVDLTGKDNSTHTVDRTKNAAYCRTSSVTGEVICVEEERLPDVPLEKGRISIQTLFSY